MAKIIRAVGTLIECNGKILILHRNKTDKEDPNTWGLPAGGIKEGEKDIDAAIREVFEETGVKVKQSQLKFIQIFKWRFPKYTIEFPTYRLQMSRTCEVKINLDDHDEFKWISPRECYQMKNLINGFHELLEKVYKVN